MLAKKIEEYDENKLIQSYSFTKTNFNGLNVLSNPYLANANKHFNKEKTFKTKIVIHHTAGAIWGDTPTLLTPSKVSVSFVISPRGTVFMLFNPAFWAFHLGKAALGGNTIQSKASIGIELSNFGWLTEKDGNLYTYTGALYCSLKDTQYYDKIKKWKGYEYFCKYTPEQYKSLKELKDTLCKVHRIPDVIFPKIDQTTEEVVPFKGITTHINFRSDKFDLSPNFDWNQITTLKS